MKTTTKLTKRELDIILHNANKEKKLMATIQELLQDNNELQLLTDSNNHEEVLLKFTDGEIKKVYIFRYIKFTNDYSLHSWE